ncbi:FKBP-type peptidyl-prolyl cis-trans isomerase [Confluentibacter sediminis]|uniref:FKBP-type peptidyl-prolyl cis-trans isomerase n=1 Tax=Confluentibacter sediminis TaxID=2219045 RepID=UPI000DAD51E0|nr:FKBP-type peptidyl-prolyl cis-trans isomerase [Confluentibacter sediminis]
MKLVKFLGAIVLASAVFSCSNKKAVTKESLKTEVDSVSYALGLDVANSVSSNFEEVNNELFLAGYMNAKDSTKMIMDKTAAQTIIQMYVQKNQAKMMQKQQEAAAKEAEKQFGAVKAAGEKFLEENKTKDGVKTTASGLQYIVEKEGTGEKPTATSTVKVHYTGTLIDGTVFDSSVERGEPAQFGVGQVIKGWTEVLQLMPVGSKYKVFIPQELAYGANPRQGGPIKPFSALIFEVELLDIVK